VSEQSSYDCERNGETTRSFYAFVLHFAVTGKTAAELILRACQHRPPGDGLDHLEEDAPQGKTLKRDIGIAENYLNEKEMMRPNRLVTMSIDYAELMAEDVVAVGMQDWLSETGDFAATSSGRRAGHCRHPAAPAWRPFSHKYLKEQAVL
jgi:hypothetical protein